MDPVSKAVTVDVGFLEGTLYLCYSMSVRDEYIVRCTRGRMGGKKTNTVCVYLYTMCNNISHLYLEPSVEVFQPSNKEGFSLGLQLKK